MHHLFFIFITDASEIKLLIALSVWNYFSYIFEFVYLTQYFSVPMHYSMNFLTLKDDCTN